MGGVALVMNLPLLAAAAEGGDAQARVEEVVVTAQRREEKLQNVPIQITAFTSQAISDAGMKSTEDAINHIPNVTFDHGDTYHGNFITMRGLTQINNADPPIAMVVDGVPLTNQKLLNVNLYDVERIEVLKGPQGSLYGRNAVGGAINIITKDPGNTLEGFGSLSYGNGNAIDGSAGLSGAIVKDKLMARVSGNYKSDDGRVKNVFRNDYTDFISHDYSFRGRVLFIPTDQLTFDFRGEYNNFRAGSNDYSAVFSANPNDFQLPQFNAPSFTYGDSYGFTLKATYTFDFATLTSITAHNKLSEIDRADLDFRNPVNSPTGIFGLGFQAGQGQDQFIKLTSQEVRLVSNGNQAFRWLIGAYYLHTGRDLETRVFVDPNSDPATEIDNPALVFAHQKERNKNNAYAVFGQADYDLTDQLTITAGLRYDEDDRNQTDPLSGGSRHRNFNWFQPKVTATYKPDDGRLLYATYSTGFRSGGFNAPLVSIPVFQPEHLTNFEAGFKTEWLDRRLIFNGAVYLTKVNNYQFFFVDAASASQIIANIEKAEIKGFELEAQATLAPGLNLTAAIGTADTSIEKSLLFPGTKGNKTPRAVPFSASSGLQYRRQLTADFEGLARIDWQHYGKKYWGADNLAVQGSYNIVNARLGVEKGGLGLYVWGKNLSNAKYYTEYFQSKYSGLDIDFGKLGQPRAYGVEVKASF